VDVEEEVRRRARAAGIDRDDLPEDPEDALELLAPAPRRRHHASAAKPASSPGRRRRRPTALLPPPDSGVTPASPPSIPLPSRDALGQAASAAAGAAAGAARAARDAAPSNVRRAGRTLTTVFGWALLLILLYQALQHAQVLTTLLAVPTQALEWLSDPTQSIPYAR